MSSGQLRAIWVKRFKKGPMDPRDMAILVAGHGLAGNANKGGRRQVILLEEEAWADALAEIPNLGVPLDPSIPANQVTIVHQVRLPRILAAVLMGAGLAAAGAVMRRASRRTPSGRARSFTSGASAAGGNV